MALAIIDDLGAIVIIAFFYTSDLSLLSYLFQVDVIGLMIFNKMGIIKSSVYFIRCYFVV